MTRAEARIDTGVARLANRWIERRWATYSGATTELYLSGCDGDSLTRKSPEFHIDGIDHAWAASDGSDISWSEGVDRHGASLTVEMTVGELHLRLETFMAHQCPGMVRQLHLFNTSSEAQCITRVATEILPLDPKLFRSEGESEGTDSRNGPTTGRSYTCALVVTPTGTLLLGGGGQAELLRFTPNPRYCAVLWSSTQKIAAGKVWAPPPAFVAWQAGHQEPDGARKLLDDLQATWQARNDR